MSLCARRAPCVYFRARLAILCWIFPLISHAHAISSPHRPYARGSFERDVHSCLSPFTKPLHHMIGEIISLQVCAFHTCKRLSMTVNPAAHASEDGRDLVI